MIAVLELFDRRCRDLRGEDDAYSSQDPGLSLPARAPMRQVPMVGD